MSGVVTPVLAGVSVSSGNIVVNWIPLQDSTYFKATVFLGANPVTGASSVDQGFGTVITPNPGLQANQSYQVMVAQCDASGKQTSPYSQPFNLLQNQATALKAYVNANNNVLVSWTLPAVGNPQGGMVSLMQTGVSAALISVQVTGNTVVLEPEVALSAANIYQVYLSPFSNGGGSTGPDNSIQLLLSPSVVDTLTYSADANQIQAFATPPSPLPPNLYLYISLYINGVFSGISTDSVAVSAGIPLLFSTINPASLYTITIRNGINGAYGPETPPSTVVVAVPVLEQIQFTGTSVEAAWKNLPVPYLITGAKIGLIGDGKGLNSMDVLGNSGTISVPTTPKCTKYELQLYATSGNSRGTRTVPVTMPSVAPVVSASSFDGSRTVISWAAIANTAGYQCTINDPFGHVLAKVQTNGTTAVLDVLLAPDVIYQATVCAYAKTAGLTLSGPLSLPGNLISVCPVLTAVNYNNGKVTVWWNAAVIPAATGVTGYQVGIYLNGQLQGALTNVTGIATGTVDISVNLSPWLAYTVAVRVVSVTSQGPFSPQSAIIAASAVLKNTFFNGTTISMNWAFPQKDAVTGYLITLFKDGTAQPITNKNYTVNSEWIFDSPLGTGLWTAAVQVVNGMATGPASAPVTFITETIAPVTVNYNDGVLTASWTKAVSNSVTGYLFSVVLNGQILQSITTNLLTASLNCKLNPANQYTCQVQALGTQVIGPALASLGILVVTPLIKSVLYRQGVLTVSWDAAGVSNTYQLLLYCDDIVVAITPQYTGLTATVAIALDKTKNYSVKVNVISGAVNGPQSPAAAVIHVSPLIGPFHYDGAKLEIEWDAVQQDGVNGYLLELAGSVSTNIILNTAFNKATVPVVFLDTETYTLKVCAVGDKASGPFSDMVNPYVIDTGYYFGAVAAATQPWISRSAVRPVSPAAFTLYLPPLFNTPPVSDLPAGLAPGGTSPFQLSKTGNTSLPYMLSIALNSDAWQFNNEPIRNNLQLDYLNFIAALEGVAGGLLPGTIPFLQQLIARSLPLTFDETLYYATGFYPAQRYINLQGGMRLSMAYGTYQFTGPLQANESVLLNGLSGNGTASYIMGSYLSGTPGAQVLDLGFSNFLSSVVQNVDANTGGGANIVDLYNSAFRQPYYRLIYPQIFPSADSKGWADNTKNVSVLGAASYTVLEQATNLVLNGGRLPDGAFLTFFRGRVSIIPEIQVFLNGKEKWVAAGSTIRNLLEEVWGTLPRIKGAYPAGSTKNIQLMRTADHMINSLNNVAANSLLGQRNQVYINYQTVNTYAGGKDNFDLPLLQGDVLITDKNTF
ncbi:hypothetical protein [Pedobacter sp. N23S346]|uniref:hypothetical protein n=1 Tax=Pedobacter sp. N23S346 TaxID=3402750 RepID=UPI003AC1DE7A